MHTKGIVNQSSICEEHIRIKKDNKIISLSGGAGYTFSFDKADLGDLNDKGLILRMRGEPELPSGYRDPSKYCNLYRRYSESLDNGELTAYGEGEGIRRALYYKVYGKEAEGASTFRFELEYKLNGIADKTEILIEVYYKGGNKIIGLDTADQVINVEMEPTGDAYNVVEQNFRVKQVIDFIFIKIAHTGLNGEFRMKSPKLYNSMLANIMLPFSDTPINMKPSRYFAENYSKVEKLPFKLYLNNQPIFSGSSHDKAISFPSHECKIDINSLHSGSNTITIEYQQEYKEQHKFLLRDISFIKCNTKGIVYAPDRVSQGKISAVIKVSADNEPIKASCSIPDIIAIGGGEIRRGLNVIDFIVVKPYEGEAVLQIEIGGKIFTHRIRRYIEKQTDVRLSTGDSVFINRNRDDIERYIEWYLSNKAGNELLLRSQYSKTGLIDNKSDYFDRVADILGGIGMPYYNLTDGDELENLAMFPTSEVKSNNFGGYALAQMDKKYLERDKQELTIDQAFYYEIISKRAMSLGINYKINLTRIKDKYVLNNTEGVKNCDLALSHAKYKDYLSEIAKICDIHFGSTVHFKYLFDAGIKEAGAVLDNASFEPIIAALRGSISLAKKNNLRLYIDTKEYLHADVIEQYRRYLATLYLGYIKGADSITTESGIYCSESIKSDAERESRSCSALLKANNEFMEFISTHNRRGVHSANIALLQGKYDGVTLTDSNAGFGEGSKNINYGLPERSWDMVRQIFYNGSTKENTWRRSFINMNINSGYFSRTPYGEVDILPIEVDAEEYNKYPYLIMVGWNTADSAFVDKISQYVAKGGCLILSAPHLYTTTVREQALAHISNTLFSDELQQLLGISELKRNGNVKITTAIPIGLEFGGSNEEIILNKFGKGKVYFFTNFRYPCENNFIYRQLIKRIAETAQKERESWGIVQSKEWVGSGIYDAADRRVIYMMDIKWWKRQKKDEKVMLSFGGFDYPLSIRRDVMNICSIFNDIAIVTADKCTDIISLNGQTLTLQGEDLTEILILYKGKITPIQIDLHGIVTLELPHNALQ